MDRLVGVRGGGHRDNFAATLSEVQRKAVPKLLKAQARFSYPDGLSDVELKTTQSPEGRVVGVTNPSQPKAPHLKELTE